MGFRDRHDVFVIGEENLPSEALDPASSEESGARCDQEPDDAVGSGLDSASKSEFFSGPRLLGALGLGALASTTLALIVLSGGSTPEKQARKVPESEGATSPSSPLITGPPAHAARSARSPRLRKARVQRADRSRPTGAGREQQREPSKPKAPTSSPTSLPEPSPVSAPPAPAELPAPTPPPPISGEGSVAEEEFGFER